MSAAVPRVLVFGCDHSDADRLASDTVRVVKLPCVGCPWVRMISCSENEITDPDIPPHLSGCAENDCFHRSGNEWTIRRMRRERDPRLRQRVPMDRLELAWLPPLAHRRREQRLREFVASLEDLER